MASLRRVVQKLLADYPAPRRVSLRRTDHPDALLAVDLPLKAGEAAAADFANRLTQMGWTVLWQDGWLLLDATVPVPDASLDLRIPGECGCVAELLMRHGGDADARDAIRRTVKAAEAGRMPFERLMTALHQELAARLRLHRTLPGALLPYVIRAYCDLYLQGRQQA